MLRSRHDLEEIEARTLASYAMHSRDSRGRRVPEPEHPMRTVFQRDRDRVIHSAAFRRLEYKTQVFVNHARDYYRTRLTHTLEAAQVTRTVAKALGLNGELAEAIALAHDLGHTPFGHAGERWLNELMEPYGGFDHNAQSLRTVDWIEVRYPNFRGLNLSFEVREGIRSFHLPVPRSADRRSGR
jgi:dGTPase